MLWSWAVQWDGHSHVWPCTLELWLVWQRMESWAWSHFVSVVCTWVPLQDEVLAGARRYSGSSSTLGPSITHKGQARGQVLTVAAPTASCNSKIPSCFYYIRFSDSFLCWVLMLFHLWQYFLLKMSVFGCIQHRWYREWQNSGTSVLQWLTLRNNNANEQLLEKPSLHHLGS